MLIKCFTSFFMPLQFALGITNLAGEPVIKSVRTKEEGRNNREALLSPLQIFATVSSEKAIGSIQLSYAKIC